MNPQTVKTKRQELVTRQHHKIDALVGKPVRHWEEQFGAENTSECLDSVSSKCSFSTNTRCSTSISGLYAQIGCTAPVGIPSQASAFSSLCMMSPYIKPNVTGSKFHDSIANSCQAVRISVLPRNCLSSYMTKPSQIDWKADIAGPKLTLNLPLPEVTISTSVGEITLPSVISGSGKIRNEIQSTAVGSTTKKYLSGVLARMSQNPPLPFEIIGDNLDWTKNPGHMSKDNQRQSLHWFLNLAVQRRVLGTGLPDDANRCSIEEVENVDFLPSLEECIGLDKDMCFHIKKTLTRYVGCLKPLAKNCALHIPHPYIAETSQKSNYAILGLMDKSENKSDDMISILQDLHTNYIPHTRGSQPHIIKKVVFGGDVLTNERAYSAQLAMLNGETEMDALSGVIHRPEGLHRMMNLLLVYFIKHIYICMTVTPSMHACMSPYNIVVQIVTL
jgi:hypothetical protein